jgi:Arc/MetJ-type ribon-helix-helix transcriptional regulator
MKHKICISISEELLLKVKDQVRNGNYKNKSHAFEHAVAEVLF